MASDTSRCWSVEAGVGRILPNVQASAGTRIGWLAAVVATAERAIRPEAIAFGVFGVVAALAALVINAVRC